MVDGKLIEDDASNNLDEKGCQKYQIMIGSLKCIFCMETMDVDFENALLYHFTAYPSKGKMDRVLHMSVYLNKYNN